MRPRPLEGDDDGLFRGEEEKQVAVQSLTHSVTHGQKYDCFMLIPKRARALRLGLTSRVQFNPSSRAEEVAKKQRPCSVDGGTTRNETMKSINKYMKQM